MEKALLLVCLTTTLVGATAAQDTEGDRATLVGLPGVGVQISVNTSDDPPPGLTENRIRIAVELRLRLSGIQVLSRDEVLSVPGFPDLKLSVLVMEVGNESRTVSGYTYTFILELLQNVYMSRDLNIGHTEGVTWKGSLSLGTVAKDDLVRTLVENVEAEVDGFINAYLAANPR